MKSIRLTLVALLVLVSSLSLKAQSIVGTWEFTNIASEGDTLVSVTLTFNEDKTFARTQKEPVLNLKNQTSTVVTTVEGKYKLVQGGKRILMKYKPSSVKVSAAEESHSKIAKLSEISQKADAAGSLYMPKIVSLTDTELVLLENVEDDIVGPDPDIDYTHNEKFTYIRKK